MGSPGVARPWRKSRTFGDVYGGRVRRRVVDGIFKRAHSIDRPGPLDELPLVIEDNPSKDMVFPASASKIVERIRLLPERDVEGITHLWLRRAKPGERESGVVPFGEFVCGSGVRMIVVYPWPSDLTLRFGKVKPPARRLREFAPWAVDLRHSPEGWSLVWTPEAVESWCLDHLVVHEVIISIGIGAVGQRRTTAKLRPPPTGSPRGGPLLESRPSNATKATATATEPGRRRVRTDRDPVGWCGHEPN